MLQSIGTMYVGTSTYAAGCFRYAIAPHEGCIEVRWRVSVNIG
jgi:hypothetical protein